MYFRSLGEELFRFVYKHEIWHICSLGHTKFIFEGAKVAAILEKSKMAASRKSEQSSPYFSLSSCTICCVPRQPLKWTAQANNIRECLSGSGKVQASLLMAFPAVSICRSLQNRLANTCVCFLLLLYLPPAMFQLSWQATVDWVAAVVSAELASANIFILRLQLADYIVSGTASISNEVLCV